VVVKPWWQRNASILLLTLPELEPGRTWLALERDRRAMEAKASARKKESIP